MSRSYTFADVDYLALLPHTPPMRLLDEVIELVPGERCRARRTTAASDFFFQGHFPGRPVVPACILVELIAQAGGLAAGTVEDSPTAGPLQLRVAALGPCKFPAGAVAGAVLDVDARVVGRLGPLVKVEGEVTVEGTLGATCGVTLARITE
jgi:3-hydroxyacyl-[acyl-carrier-protein] dehydratase